MNLSAQAFRAASMISSSVAFDELQQIFSETRHGRLPPQPDGPTRATFQPGLIFRFSLSNTCCCLSLYLKDCDNVTSWDIVFNKSSCKIQVMSQVVSLFLPILFCGDEITDILYLIFNWDSFASQDFKNAAIAFTLLNAIANFIGAIIVAFFLQGMSTMSFQKIFACICFCAWVPVFGIVYFLVYFKFIDLAIRWKKADLFLKQVDKITTISHVLHYCELFLEDIPQLIIQPLNNTATDQWNGFEYVSLIFTIATIGYQVINFMFCREKNVGTVHDDPQIESRSRIQRMRNIDRGQSFIEIYNRVGRQSNLPPINRYTNPYKQLIRDLY